MKLRLSKFAAAAAAIALCGYAAAQSPQLLSANAQLSQDVNTKNVTDGQAVNAKPTADVMNSGKVELAKGTTLVGKVTQIRKAMAARPPS
jgi:hypothetical protein